MKGTVSGIMLLTVLLGVLTLAFDIPFVKAAGTIYIRADGSIDPPTANITTSDYVTYIFTDNNYDSIVVERDNIVIDGKGFTVQGTESYNSMGIDLLYRKNVVIKNARITAFDYGISLDYSENVTVHGNSIETNVRFGIFVYSSSNCTLFQNSVAHNGFGIGLYYSLDNTIYHNSFDGNTVQAEILDSTNRLDDGYPSGGNYWSDYAGVDEFRGPGQDELGSDGIGDMPYVIDASNQDNYPLMTPCVQSIGGIVGVTGCKLVFRETIRNVLGLPAIIDYYWSFSADKWNGTQWVDSGISDSSIPVVGYSVPALTTVNLPYYVYFLVQSYYSLKWGDWLRITCTFHWTYSGVTYSTGYVAKLNLHFGDIAGAPVTFPYLGADGVCNIKDATLIGRYWDGLVTPSTDPTCDLARADIQNNGIVNIADVTFVGTNWMKTWTNTPPPG